MISYHLLMDYFTNLALKVKLSITFLDLLLKHMVCRFKFSKDNEEDHVLCKKI